MSSLQPLHEHYMFNFQQARMSARLIIPVLKLCHSGDRKTTSLYETHSKHRLVLTEKE